MTFVDSNVLVYLFDYLFDSGSPQKKATAQRLIQEEGGSGNLVLSTQVLQEFYVTVTRKLSQPLKPETAIEAVTSFAAFTLITVDLPIILSAMRRSHMDSLSFWDALIVDAALAAGVQRLWSEDLQDGREIDGMRIENPFA